MKYYYDGRYWTENINDKEKAFLKLNAPLIYNRLFGYEVPKQKPLEKGLHIYQTYFDDISKSKLDAGFIPYKTGFNHNFENDIILDIWRSRTWIKADYVGVLSWRFFEKTGLLSSKLKLKGDINCYFPQGYEKYEHPYTRKGYLTVNRMVDLADNYCLFPFKLSDYKVNNIVWCNYWIVKPAIFDDYCTRYLSKAIEFFKDKPEYNLTEYHRGKHVPALTFFLEGLFSIYLQHENKKANIH